MTCTEYTVSKLRFILSHDLTLTKHHSSSVIDLEVPVAQLGVLLPNDDRTQMDETWLTGETWLLNQHRCSLGSSASADIQISHPTISRQHAYIEVDERGYRLIDRQSKNGVFINQVQVIEAFLKDGDLIQIGEIKLLFQVLNKQAKALQLWSSSQFGELYGQSKIMRELFALLHRVAQSEINVLIEGESGTGKELAARAIHDYSSRSKKPFVVFDCSSVPSQLIESELFGHVKGSFTGAAEHRQGAFAKANEGTLFLDEIGELPLELQPKLLRVIERNEIKPVGADAYTKIDVRIVSATHRKLSEEVELKKFRLDLFYRLAVVKVLMPALREHREDIPGLVDRMIEAMTHETREVSYKTMNLLMQHEWQGNIRELKNYVQKAIALSNPQQKNLETQFLLPQQLGQAVQSANYPSTSITESEIDPHDLVERDLVDRDLVDYLEAQPPSLKLDLSREFKDAKSDLIDQFERVYWNTLITKYNNNISAAARAAGIHRKSAEYIIKKLGLRIGDDDV